MRKWSVSRVDQMKAGSNLAWLDSGRSRTSNIVAMTALIRSHLASIELLGTIVVASKSKYKYLAQRREGAKKG
jgi:hypothetical protein